MAKQHVLVVDDEKDIVEFLTQLLEDNGYRVSSANDGMEVVATREVATVAQQGWAAFLDA